MNSGDRYISFSGSNYAEPKRRVYIIRSNYKFKIDAGKCRSYINLHLHPLIPTQLMLERCQKIFNILARYAHECDGEDDYNIFYSEQCWQLYTTREYIFRQIFADNLHIMFDLEYEEEYSLMKLLTDDIIYNKFLEVWSKFYDCEDLINVMIECSKYLLTNSLLGNTLPVEIIEKILIIAHNSL